MSGAGGGPPYFGAYALVRWLFRRGRSVDELKRQAELDREELREVEYEEMGLPLPKAGAEHTKRHRFLMR